MNNPGKYDDLCTMVREATQAKGVVLIIYDGNKGLGCSVQATMSALMNLPEILEVTANGIRNDLP